MDYRELKDLLNKYNDAVASNEEENKLREALLSYAGNDESLIKARSFMVWGRQQAQLQSELSFEDVLVHSKKPVIRRIGPWIGAVAAVLVVGLLINGVIKTQQEPIIYAYVDGKAITNKNEAINYAYKAFSEVNEKIDKGAPGINALATLNKPVELLTNKTK